MRLTIEITKETTNEQLVKLERVIKALESIPQTELDRIIEEQAPKHTSLYDLPTRKPGKKLRNGGKKAIIAAIQRNGGMASIAELLLKIPDYTPNTIKGNLYELRAEGIIEGNTEHPKRYFIKNEGNPALKELFPRGTKTSVMR